MQNKIVMMFPVTNEEIRNKEIKLPLIEKIIRERNGSINAVLHFSIIWNDEGSLLHFTKISSHNMNKKLFNQ